MADRFWPMADLGKADLLAQKRASISPAHRVKRSADESGPVWKQDSAMVTIEDATSVAVGCEFPATCAGGAEDLHQRVPAVSPPLVFLETGSAWPHLRMAAALFAPLPTDSAAAMSSDTMQICRRRGGLRRLKHSLIFSDRYIDSSKARRAPGGRRYPEASFLPMLLCRITASAEKTPTLRTVAMTATGRKASHRGGGTRSAMLRHDWA